VILVMTLVRQKKMLRLPSRALPKPTRGRERLLSLAILTLKHDEDHQLGPENLPTLLPPPPSAGSTILGSSWSNLYIQYLEDANFSFVVGPVWRCSWPQSQFAAACVRFPPTFIVARYVEKGDEP
jgi:hypothetical protein